MRLGLAFGTINIMLVRVRKVDAAAEDEEERDERITRAV